MTQASDTLMTRYERTVLLAASKRMNSTVDNRAASEMVSYFRSSERTIASRRLDSAVSKSDLATVARLCEPPSNVPSD